MGTKKLRPQQKGRSCNHYAVPPNFSRESLPFPAGNGTVCRRRLLPPQGPVQRRRSKRNFPPSTPVPRLQPVTRNLWPGGAGVLSFVCAFLLSYHKTLLDSRGNLHFPGMTSRYRMVFPLMMGESFL